MKYLLLAILFINLISGVFSATALEYLKPIPGHEGLCYEKNSETFYKPGETMKWDKEYCGTKICSLSENQLSIQYFTCGIREVTIPGCYLEEDLSLPYPKCCKQVKCGKNKISDDIK